MVDQMCHPSRALFLRQYSLAVSSYGVSGVTRMLTEFLGAAVYIWYNLSGVAISTITITFTNYYQFSTFYVWLEQHHLANWGRIWRAGTSLFLSQYQYRYLFLTPFLKTAWGCSMNGGGRKVNIMPMLIDTWLMKPEWSPYQKLVMDTTHD